MTDVHEHLTTGWDRAAPVDDTFLRRFLHHLAATNAAFVAAAGARPRTLDGMEVADAGRPFGYWSAVVLTEPPADWRATLAALGEAVRGGRGDVWCWSAWPTPDLREQGWELSGHPPVLLRPPATVAPLPPFATGGPTTRVAEVRDEDALAAWERVAVEAYPIDDVAGVRGAFAPPALLSDHRVRLWTASDDGRPVGAGAAFESHGLASLAFGATLPGARGRGAWRSLAAVRVLAHPDHWVAGVFSDLSRPLAEALGFLPITRLTLWRLPRP